jgi:HPt (histidine-containing phosphotransfer) domain-containing protein
MVYVGLKYRLNGIVYFCVGAALNSIFQLPILAGYIGMNNQENGYYVLLASFSMALSLALVNAKEFAVTYKKSVRQGRVLEQKNQEITYFNKNLEKMVQDKTQEIRVLLDYIPQGVLSLEDDGFIANDFSAHLRNILESNDISGYSFNELVLKNCRMGSDERDQAWQAILSTVGESELNLMANEDKLPRELSYQSPSGEKTLKVTWNVQVDENNIVQRLLVTLLDITAEKALEREAAQQRQEMRKIQELLNIPAGKMAQFFLTSRPLLEENRSIIASNRGHMNPHSLRTLFVNAHTVKGASRTLHLKELTTAIHDMEDYYSHILRHNEPVDHECLTSGIDNSLAVFKEYEIINSTKLNRSDDYSKVIIERDFIEKHYQMIKNLITCC